MKHTTIVCVAPFNNPHIVPMYDEMARAEWVKVTRVSLRALAQERLSLGWPEMAPDSPYLQPWRRLSDRLAYYWKLLSADVVILPGFFHFPTLPFHHWLRRLTGKPTLLWSEPFLDHPRTSRSGISLMLRRLLLAPCDSPNVHLLAAGRGAEIDFYRLGVCRWNTWVFGFSTYHDPKEKPDLSVPLSGTVRLVYSGSLIKRKGVDILLSALGQTDLAQRDWHLTIVGDGPERLALEDQIRKLGVSSKVELTGALPIQQCANVYRRSQILILPSRFDGWGAVLNEAMGHGLAVIASDRVGATRPLLVEGKTGFLFRSEDTDDLVRRVMTLVDDRDLLQRMRRAALERIWMFQPAEVARRLLLLCCALAGGERMQQYHDGYCVAVGLQATEESSPPGQDLA
ncbi:MAG: glycosyltransferase family 4 protein [Planctomycetaceae bacterium]|nr:glycosyltransferase family 4 protein [Planctomycetaceae bacterium]